MTGKKNPRVLASRHHTFRHESAMTRFRISYTYLLMFFSVFLKLINWIAPNERIISSF